MMHASFQSKSRGTKSGWHAFLPFNPTDAFHAMADDREPQKCYCGAEKCRGFIGGQKNMPVRKKKDRTVERRKVGLFEDEMVSTLLCFSVLRQE